MLGRIGHQEAVTTLPWPARSQDLNPIEMVWDIMGRRVCEREPPVQNLGGTGTDSAPGMKQNTSTSRTVDGEEGLGRCRRRRWLHPLLRFWEVDFDEGSGFCSDWKGFHQILTACYGLCTWVIC